MIIVKIYESKRGEIMYKKVIKIITILLLTSHIVGFQGNHAIAEESQRAGDSISVAKKTASSGDPFNSSAHVSVMEEAPVSNEVVPTFEITIPKSNIELSLNDKAKQLTRGEISHFIVEALGWMPHMQNLISKMYLKITRTIRKSQS